LIFSLDVRTIKDMKIEFDLVKDTENRNNHDGLSLLLAEELDWDYALDVQDR
jgi:uncharacterized DUF497 family protein